MIQTRSIAETLARLAYNRSDKANAAENQNKEWQAGYRTGTTVTEPMKAIQDEFSRRGNTSSPGFREWKAGLWAARFHRLEAELQA